MDCAGEIVDATSANADVAASGTNAQAAPLADKAEKVARTTSDMTAFKARCEKHCRQELEARMVSMLGEGDHVEINASITTTRLYQNLSASAPCMAFYDVKNAKLCNIWQGEGLTHRELALGEEDFERFTKTIAPLLHAKRDVFWILCSRMGTRATTVKQNHFEEV